MAYGERIRQGRKRLGLTQRQLARRLGATDGYISHLEKGLRLPSWEFAVGLARVLELSEQETRRLLDEIDVARIERARRRSDSRARAVGVATRSPDADHGPPTLQLLDLDDGAEASIFSEAAVRCVALGRNGALAGGTEDGAILIWNSFGELRHHLRGHRGPIGVIACSSDGKSLASGGEDGLLKIWRSADGAERCTVPGPTSVTALIFSRDGRLVVAGYRDGTIRFWEVASGAERRSLITHAGAVQTLAFSPDGELLASGDGGVTLWNREGQAVRVLRGLGPPVRVLAFSHDGRRLAGGSGEGRVQVWEVPEGQELYELPVSGRGVVALGFSADDSKLVTLSQDGRVESWSMTSGRSAGSVSTRFDAVASAALAPDGSSLLVFGRALVGAADRESSVVSAAAELEADPGLQAAYRDLLAAYSDPELRQAVVLALRGFAQAAGAPEPISAARRPGATSAPSLRPRPDRG